MSFLENPVSKLLSQSQPTSTLHTYLDKLLYNFTQGLNEADPSNIKLGVEAAKEVASAASFIFSFHPEWLLFLVL